MKPKILSAVLIFSFIMSAAACGEQAESNTPASTTAVTEQILDENETTTAAELQPDLPDYDCNGETFTFMVRGPSFNEWQSQDIYAAEENGEPVNDAVYRRNLFIAEKYNVKIEEFQATDVGGQGKKAVNAGDQTIDIIMPNTSECSTLASQGYLYNLNEIDYIDLDQPWWDQQSRRDLSMENLLYFVNSDIGIMVNDATWIMMFNKQIAKDYGITDLYSSVADGKWTFDKMIELMELVSADLNGDGVISPKDDRLGFATHASSIEGLFFGADLHTMSKDDDDVPYIDMDIERISGVIELANLIMCDKEISFNLSSNKFGMSNALTDLQPVFENNHSLFYGEVMQCIIRLRAMETDFGVIPFPKFNETQGSYSHYVNTTGCMITIPLSSPDIERDGIILEAMAAKSRYTLRSAYIETCLQGKFMRDNESEGSLEIILDTRSYDLGYIYGWGGLFSAFSSCVSKGNTDFSSQFASKEAKAEKALEKTLTAWEDNA